MIDYLYIAQNRLTNNQRNLLCQIYEKTELPWLMAMEFLIVPEKLQDAKILCALGLVTCCEYHKPENVAAGLTERGLHVCAMLKLLEHDDLL